jgi:hypothetical protein
VGFDADYYQALRHPGLEINILNLIDRRRNPDNPLLMFGTYRELLPHRNKGEEFPKGRAREDGFLQTLLEILDQRAKFSEEEDKQVFGRADCSDNGSRAMSISDGSADGSEQLDDEVESLTSTGWSSLKGSGGDIYAPKLRRICDIGILSLDCAWDGITGFGLSILRLVRSRN